ALAEPDLGRAAIGELQAIRGLVRKAVHATRSLSVFVHLARGEAIEYRPVPLHEDEAYKEIWELCVDASRQYRARRIGFEIARSALVGLRASRVDVDRDLFRQSVANLVDNAFKYGFRDTTVRITGELLDRNWFALSVANVGIAVSAEDIPRFLSRSVRGEQAKLVSGEGSGLGLWLTSHIMKRHGGRLELQPTGPDGWTVAQLVFPALG